MPARIAADLRDTLVQRRWPRDSAPKFPIAIDGGGALDLARLAADIRLARAQAVAALSLHVGVGGDEASAADLGVIAPAHGVEAVMRLLECLAKRGRDARARDVLAAEGIDISAPPSPAFDFRLVPAKAGTERIARAASAIGLHRLRDGSLACGIGLAFGHADAASLDNLADAAARSRRRGFPRRRAEHCWRSA